MEGPVAAGMERDLDGKLAFITGASRGIGRAVAQKLAARGARVGIGYRREREAAEHLVRELEGLGGGGVPIQLDAGDAEAGDLRRLVRTHMATQIHELLARVLRHPPCKLLVIDPQRIGEFADAIRRPRQATRVQPDAIDRRTDGQRLSIAIRNRTAVRGDLLSPQMPRIGLLIEEVFIEYLQVHGSSKERHGEHREKDAYERQPAHEAPRGLLFRFRPPSHGRSIT